MLFKKRDKYQFSGKMHSVQGIISFILGLLVLIGFVVLACLSGAAKGAAGLYVGILGLLLFGVSIFGGMLGVKACKQKDIYYQLPVLGVFLNGAFTVIFVVLYFIGI